MCMKMPKAPKPPAPPPPAPDMEDVTNLKLNERDKEAANSEATLKSKRRGRGTLRIDRSQPAATTSAPLNIPR
jgi:hypothetical protein